MPNRFRPRTITLRDGTRLTVRRIEPGDKALLVAAFERLSEHSRYRRFMSPMPTLAPVLLAFLTEVDHRDHEALIAVDPASGRMTAVARYVRSRDDPASAEVAVTVADDWHRRGVGRAILEVLTDRARREGVQRFTALMLAENRGAMGLLSTLGETELRPGGSEVQLTIELPAERGLGANLAATLRAVAAGMLPAPRATLPPPRLGQSIRTVVVGTDGSPTAGRAVEVAVRLTALVHGTLHVVSAHPPRDAARAATALDGAVAAARAAGLEVVPHARRGDAPEALVAVAIDAEADLIVVGNRGMAGVRRLAPSVPDAVSHRAPCSVLIVRTDGAPAT